MRKIGLGPMLWRKLYSYRCLDEGEGDCYKRAFSVDAAAQLEVNKYDESGGGILLHAGNGGK